MRGGFSFTSWWGWHPATDGVPPPGKTAGDSRRRGLQLHGCHPASTLPVAAPPHREGGARRCPPPPPLTVWMQRERGGAAVGAPPHQLLASCGGGGLSAGSALPHRAMLDVSARPQHHRVCLGDGGHMGGKGGIAREGRCSLNVLLSHWRSAGAILWNTSLWKTTVTMQATRGDDGGCVERLNAVRVMLRPCSRGWRRVSFVVKNNG